MIDFFRLEAKHFGSIHALHRAKWNSSMYRMIPPGYVKYWHELEDIRKAKVEVLKAKKHDIMKAPDPFGITANAMRREREEEWAKQARARPAQVSEVLPIVRISEKMRKAIESVLDPADFGTTAKPKGDDADQGELIKSIVKLGFREPHVEEAVQHSSDREEILDWLCLHVPEQDLPVKFKPQIQRMEASHHTPESLANEYKVQRLVERGFSHKESSAALAKVGYVEMLALKDILYRLWDQEIKPSDDDAAVEQEEITDMVNDECEALSMILGDAFSVEDTPEAKILSISINMAKVVKRAVLEITIPTDSRYPFQPPLVTFRAEELPTYVRLIVLKTLGAICIESTGETYLYELHEWLIENLAAVVAEPPPLATLKTYAEKKQLQSTMQQKRQSTQQNRPQRGGRQRPKLSKDQMVAESKRLRADLDAQNRNPKYLKLKSSREKLPAATFRERITSCIRENSVTVISGETGCGKTTQVPQFVLEDLIARNEGAGMNMICTQPRRLSAIAVAGRVAVERNEPVGSIVGYSIRLENKQSARTRLLFCTTGILLQQLQKNPDLEGVSHVFVDEVHERSLDSDVVLALVRDVVKRRKDLRLILMSATLDADRFSSYYGGCPVLSIPGFTHPVKEHYLGEIVDILGYDLYKYQKWKGKGKGYQGWNPNKQQAATNTSKQFVKAQPSKPVEKKEKKEKVEKKVAKPAEKKVQKKKKAESEDEEPDAVSDWEDASSEDEKETKAKDGGDTEANGAKDKDAKSDSSDDDWESQANDDANKPVVDTTTGTSTKAMHPEDPRKAPVAKSAKKEEGAGSDREGYQVDAKLLKLLVEHIIENDEEGAILVFVAGMLDIKKCIRELDDLNQTSSERVIALPLHSSLTAEEQNAIFRPSRPGERKVIVATNVAETSITIDGVTHVIDSGKMKETRYDVANGMTCLVETWVSKASARQRRGRAGRTRPGQCWRLYSDTRFEEFDAHQKPEILRVPLEQLYLRIKALSQANVGDYLRNMLDAPDKQSIDSALATLQGLSAIDEDENITALGKHLADIPADVRIGKFLIFAAILGCVEPALTIAGCISLRSFFLSPMAARDEANAAHAKFASQKSDLLTMVAAYDAWRDAFQNGQRAARDFAVKNFLSHQTLEQLHSLRGQFSDILRDIGFRGRNYEESNRFSSDTRIVKAALCAGLYPRVVKVVHPKTTYVQTEHGAVAKSSNAKELKLFVNSDSSDRRGARVFLHPSSINFHEGKYETQMLLYNEKMSTSKVFLKDSTMVSPIPILFFGGKIEVNHEKGWISVGADKWVRFKAPAREGVLIRQLRKAVDRVLAYKIEDPRFDLGSNSVIKVLIKLLSTDGDGG